MLVEGNATDQVEVIAYDRVRLDPLSPLPGDSCDDRLTDVGRPLIDRRPTWDT